MIYDVIVIGAGPSGMLCAGYLGQAGKNVLLLEKKDKVGSKLRITGKGRCNVTNGSPLKEHLSNILPKSNFLKTAYSKYFVKDVVDFFASQGVELKEERGNRYFPVSDNAQDIVDCLHKFCLNNKVTIKYNKSIITCYKTDEVFYAKDQEDTVFSAYNLVIATGGASYPVTGSTGDGQVFAKSFGHTINELKAGLVPFNTKGDLAQRMQGVSLKNVSASIWHKNKKLHEEFGEMMFTHFGLTGPIILTLSNKISDLPIKELELKIDLKPALDHNKLDERLLRDFNEHGKKKFETVLKLLLPKKMIEVCSQELEIPLNTTVNQITSKQRKALRLWLKELTFCLHSTRSFKEAIITIGGISTNEINKNTFESKIIPKLYFCGEVIDLHANTGGFNLQIAFSTAYCLAKSII